MVEGSCPMVGGGRVLSDGRGSCPMVGGPCTMV